MACGCAPTTMLLVVLSESVTSAVGIRLWQWLDWMRIWGGLKMLDLFSFLYGVVAVLLIESVALILAKEWLRKEIEK